MNHQKPEVVKEMVATHVYRFSNTDDTMYPAPLDLRRFTSTVDVPKISKDASKLWKLLHTGNWQNISNVQKAVKYVTDFSVSRSGYCHPAAVMGAISRARRNENTDPVSRNATVCVDVGDVTLWTSLSLTLAAGSRTLYSERLGTMGYALNAAVAAILSRPEPASAVVLAGDGGFQMSLQELATFQQHKRPGDKLLCIVFDNEMMGRVAFGFDNAGGCEMTGPDYVQLAKSYGGDGVRLSSTEDAQFAVKTAMASEGLYLIHVLVDPFVKADMASFKDNSLEVMNSG
jgi:thiamine pyrophosphate-dependent acetolactate synthase large subunit-like protein